MKIIRQTSNPPITSRALMLWILNWPAILSRCLPGRVLHRKKGVNFPPIFSGFFSLKDDENGATHRLVPNKDPPCPVQPPTSPHLISLIWSKKGKSKNQHFLFRFLHPGVLQPRLCQLETYLSFGQSLKSIVDSKHSVTFCDSHPDS